MKTCYLVAIAGANHGVVASVTAFSEAQAKAACEALFIDSFGEDGHATVFDEGAKPGLWIEGDPDHIRRAVS